jgi:N-acetylglucosaminyldiphosphoundecaprenol N-acetyl-beta-D-mannosaminyltransferase
MESQRHPDLRRIHNTAGLVTPDGMPLVWLGRRAGHAGMGRVYGPDLMLELCARGVSTGLRHHFFGGGPGVVDALASRLTQRYPGLIVAGAETPPFGDMAATPDAAAVTRINQAAPHVIWVGLGTPKQERWMALHRPLLDAPVLICVGAAFDFHAGLKPQAPAWMQRAGLEWLFRLAIEPRRLWRRYLINNPWFILMVALQAAGLRHYTLDP